jgi:hypothetical protein
MPLVAQPHPVAQGQVGGVGVGRTDGVVGRAHTASPDPLAVLLAALSQPVVPASVGRRQLRGRLRARPDGPRGRRDHRRGRGRRPRGPVVEREQVVQMGPRRYREAWLDRLHRGVGHHLGRVAVKLRTPDQARRLTPLHDLGEEAPEDLQAVALPDARQAGVIGQRLIQVVPAIPAGAQPVSDEPHQLALRANALKEHYQLEFEEDHGVDAGPSSRRVVGRHQLPHEAQVEDPLQMAVDVVVRHQLLQTQVFHWREHSRLNPHHRVPRPLSSRSS